MRRSICFCLLAVALFSQAGCGNSSNPGFFVAIASSREGSTFVPQGYSWNAGSEIDISVWGEPKFEDGEIVTTHQWKSVGTAKADQYGMFGYNSGALKYLVQRTIPGAPPQWLPHPIFLAREKNTGTVKFYNGHNAEWFTFQ